MQGCADGERPMGFNSIGHPDEHDPLNNPDLVQLFGKCFYYQKAENQPNGSETAFLETIAFT